LQKIKLAKQSEHVYIKELKNRSEANWFILKLYISEAKRTGLIVILYLKSHKKANFFFKRKAKTKVFDNELSKFAIPSQDGVQKAPQLHERKVVHWCGSGDNTGPSRRFCHGLGLHLMKDQLSHAILAEHWRCRQEQHSRMFEKGGALEVGRAAGQRCAPSLHPYRPNIVEDDSTATNSRTWS
jgi:hypothetical protein